MIKLFKTNVLARLCATLYYLIAIILEKGGSNYCALRLVEKALLKEPHQPALHLYASRLHLKRGQVDGSVMHWKKAVGSKHLGSFMYWLNSSKNKKLHHPLAQDKVSPDATSKSTATDDSSYTKAMAKPIDNDPGLILLQKGLLQEALSLFLQDLKKETENPVLFINIALTYSKLNQHRQAVDYYEKAQTKGLNSLELLNNKGYSLYYLRRFEEALACFELIRNLDVHDAAVSNNLASCYVQTNQVHRALNYFLAAFEHHDTDAVLVNNLALCLAMVGQPTKSLQYYKKALTLTIDENTKYKIATNLVLCLMQLRQYEEALAAYEKYLRTNKKHEVWGLKADILNLLGRTEEAAENYRKALGLVS